MYELHGFQGEPARPGLPVAPRGPRATWRLGCSGPFGLDTNTRWSVTIATREIPGPFDPKEIRRFLDTFMYREAAFLVDEVIELNAERREVRARLDTRGRLAYTREQRVAPGHPAHVAGGDLITITGSLGCLHAWFFYGCRWDEGWTGFGYRIHRADFKELAEIGPPLDLLSRELHSRPGTRRLVIRYEFEFRQGERLIYYGDQSAIFLKDGFGLAASTRAVAAND